MFEFLKRRKAEKPQSSEAPDSRADELREGIGTEPAQCLLPVAALEEDEADGVHPVGEVMADDGKKDQQPRRRADLEGEADSEPVDQAVHREAGGAERPDVCMCARLLGLVAVVEDEYALSEEERQKSDADDREHVTGLVE